MRDVCAFVVGIARYGMAWNSNSAAQNAYGIVRLLLLGGVPPERINAFIDTEGLSPHQQQALIKRGVRVRSTTASEISVFWRSELPRLLSPGDKIFSYWSGHGAADQSQNRIFFCRDYSDAQINAVFNATEFLAFLRSGNYAQSERQMFFADVCGTYTDSSIAPTDSRPLPVTMREVDQLSIYASPDGAYADADEYGAFTSILFGVFGEFRDEWPSSDEFLTKLKAATEQIGQRPFWIRWAGKHQQELGEQLVGRSNGYVKAITRLLAPYALAGDILKRPYLKTIRNRRVEPLVPSYALAQLVDALSAIADERESGAPLALVQFLMRLSREAKLDKAAKEAINHWIINNTTPQVRAEIDHGLFGEPRQVVLSIDISNNREGLPTLAEAQLLESDGWPVAGFVTSNFTVTSDSDLMQWIGDQLQKTLELDEKAIPEIHVFVDPPLFHLPFHKADFELFALGKLFDCILHYRRRALGDARTQPDRWESWAKSLRGIALDRLAVLRIDPQPAAIPAGNGLCFANFAHGPLSRSQAQVLRLTELLLRGAPYLCWPIDNGALSSVDVGATFKTMVASAIEFHSIPKHIREKRLDGCAVANELAVLWDDPDQKLLPSMRGVDR